MTNYKLSTGDKISKQAIDRNVSQAKASKIEAQFNEYGYNFCEHCLRSGGVRLSISHKTSVNDCQRNAQSELAWDINNLQVLCIECHQVYDNNNVRL